MAIVQVFTIGRARHARNIWLIAAIHNIQFIFSHIAGRINKIADILSYWSITVNLLEKLNNLIIDYMWVDIHLHSTLLSYNII